MAKNTPSGSFAGCSQIFMAASSWTRANCMYTRPDDTSTSRILHAAHESLTAAYVLSRWEASGFSLLCIDVHKWSAKCYIVPCVDSEPILPTGLWVFAHRYPLTSIKDISGDHDANSAQDLLTFRDNLADSFRANYWLYDFVDWANRHKSCVAGGYCSFSSRVYDMPLLISYVDYDVFSF